MASYDWGTIEIERRRTVDYQFVLYSANSTGISLDATDVVRFKLFRADGGIDLDIDSSATTNGSVVTVDNSTAPAACTVRFAQGDVTALTKASYRGEICVVDDSETAPADAIKRAGVGRVKVLESGGGDVGKT